MRYEKNDAAAICLAAVSIVIQWFLMYSSQVLEISLPFACGLSGSLEKLDAVSQLVFFIIPVPFLLWIFSGRTERVIRDIGQIYIIRNYSRRRILLKEIGRTGAVIIFLELFTYVIFTIGRNPHWEELGVKNEVKVMAEWTIVMMAVVLLQMLLEFIVGISAAQIAVLLYYVISIFVGSLLAERKMHFWRWVLFPNLGFSWCSKVTENGSNAFVTSFTGAVLLCAGLAAVSLWILKKKDIL